MIKLAVSGARGRMGSRILALASQDSVFKVAAALETSGHPDLGKDVGGVRLTSEADSALKSSDVLIEFTTPQATVVHLKACVSAGKPIVIGTTGLSEKEMAEVQAASKKIPVLLSPNMSVGVNLLFELVQDAARKLGPSYEVEIIETHHHGKKDSPSGTAKRLAQLIAQARKLSLEKVAVYGRQGISESRSPSQIGIHSIRAGDVVGDHTVIFATEGERLEFTHRASSRDTFARGALSAARFLVGKKAGLYSLRDLLISSPNES